MAADLDRARNVAIERGDPQHVNERPDAGRVGVTAGELLGASGGNALIDAFIDHAEHVQRFAERPEFAAVCGHRGQHPPHGRVAALCDQCWPTVTQESRRGRTVAGGGRVVDRVVEPCALFKPLRRAQMKLTEPLRRAPCELPPSISVNIRW